MASSRVRRVRRGEKQWAEILRRFESSRLGAAAFCHREGLALSSLQRWRQRLGSPAEARFVELVPAVSAGEGQSAWSLELVLPNGVAIRLRG